MRKLLLLAGAAVAASQISLASVSLAQAANAEPFSPPQHFSQQDLSAFADARIAGLKAGLQLTSAQEKNWPSLETAMREVAKARIARFQEFREGKAERPGVDPLAAMQRRAQGMSARAAELEKLSAAAKPLYDSLDDTQKHRFGFLMRAATHGSMHAAHHFMGPQGGAGGQPL